MPAGERKKPTAAQRKATNTRRAAARAAKKDAEQATPVVGVVIARVQDGDRIAAVPQAVGDIDVLAVESLIKLGLKSWREAHGLQE